MLTLRKTVKTTIFSVKCNLNDAQILTLGYKMFGTVRPKSIF